MSYREDRREADSIFESVRQKYNPDWRKYRDQHRKTLHSGPETEGMGAREIIRRAMLLDGVKPKEKKQFRRI